MSRHLKRLERGKTVADKVTEVLGQGAAASLLLAHAAAAEHGSSSEDDSAFPSTVPAAPPHYITGRSAEKKRRQKQQKLLRSQAATATTSDTPSPPASPTPGPPAPSADASGDDAGRASGGGSEEGNGAEGPASPPTVRRKKKKKNGRGALAAGTAPAAAAAGGGEEGSGEESEGAVQESLEEIEAMMAEAAAEQQPAEPADGAEPSGTPVGGPPLPTVAQLFTLSANSLDAAAELKRIFGANVTALADSEASAGRARFPPAQPKSLLVTPDPRWPPVTAKGFDIQFVWTAECGTKVYEVRESGESLKVSKAVRASLVSDDVNRLQMLMQRHPWHLRACYQYAVMACVNGRQDEGAGIFRRAAHAFAVISRGSLSLLDPYTSRVFPYVKDASDVVFLSLQQLMHAHIRAGCLGAAFEVSKLVFNLDPSDPCGALFNVEYLAIRSQHAGWLAQATERWRADGADYALLPIATFGSALAALQLGGPGSRDRAAAFLRRALLTWPLIGLQLLKEEDRPIWEVHCGALPPCAPPAANAAACYARRMEELWSERGCQRALRDACRGLAEAVGDDLPEVLAGRARERDALLSGAIFAEWYGAALRPDAVAGVVDEIMPGRDQERVRLQRAWSAPLNNLPQPVQHMVLDRLADHDYSPLACYPAPVLVLLTLLPWNSLPLMLSRKLLAKWREENPQEADEWDTDMEVQRRLRLRGLV